jgi:hypothetical protein
MCHLTGFQAVMDTRLAIEMAHVVFDGVDRDDQCLCDFRVSLPGNKQPEHTLFLQGHRVEKFLLSVREVVSPG